MEDIRFNDIMIHDAAFHNTMATMTRNSRTPYPKYNILARLILNEQLTPAIGKGMAAALFWNALGISMPIQSSNLA